MRRVFYLFLLVFPFHAFSQRISNTASYRNIENDRYFRLSYDNDYFTATDIYYTQGINVELVSPALGRNPLNFVLLREHNKPVKHGVALDHFGFTPTSIRSNEILNGDRPFAGNLTLKSFNIIYDTTHSAIYSSSVSFGVIGPWAGGEGMQREIHEATNNAVPLGWEHQIRNDISVSYEASLEKLLYHYRNAFAVNGSAAIKAGTLNDKVNAGFNFRLGRLDPIFNSRPVARLQVYFFSESLINLIGYDATLQGGMFNRTSPYTIASSEIERITFQENFGLVLKWNKVYLEYFQSLLTHEFAGARNHRWGGIKIGLII